MTFDEFLAEEMKDPEFREAYEDLAPEYEIINAMLDVRIAQDLTQRQLAELTGIRLTDISRLENGARNPSLDLLKRLAKGLGKQLHISFEDRKAEDDVQDVENDERRALP